MRGLVLSLFALPAFAGDIPHLSEAQARMVGLSSDGKAYAFRVVSTFVDPADRGFCKYPDVPEQKTPDGVELRLCGPTGKCERFEVYGLAKYEEKYVEGGPPLLPASCTETSKAKATLDKAKARAKELGIDLETRPEPLSAAKTASVKVPAVAARAELTIGFTSSSSGALVVTRSDDPKKPSRFRAELAADRAIGVTYLPMRDTLVFFVGNSSGWLLEVPSGRPGELALGASK